MLLPQIAAGAPHERLETRHGRLLGHAHAPRGGTVRRPEPPAMRLRQPRQVPGFSVSVAAPLEGAPSGRSVNQGHGLKSAPFSASSSFATTGPCTIEPFEILVPPTE